MLKLFFLPGACCMSCHIALEETQLPFEVVYVGKNADEKVRQNFLSLNPMGTVPTLQLSSSQVLTQNLAILEWIADQKPSSRLLDNVGTYERADMVRWLSFVAADLHKAYGPLFYLNTISTNPSVQEDIKRWSFSSIEKYLTLVDAHLQNKNYLCAERFTVADAYLYTVVRWSYFIAFPMEKFTALNHYMDRLHKRPSIIAVHKREEKFR